MLCSHFMKAIHMKIKFIHGCPCVNLVSAWSLSIGQLPHSCFPACSLICRNQVLSVIASEHFHLTYNKLAMLTKLNA
jgi:hypothetical protein